MSHLNVNNLKIENLTNFIMLFPFLISISYYYHFLSLTRSRDIVMQRTYYHKRNREIEKSRDMNRNNVIELKFSYHILVLLSSFQKKILLLSRDNCILRWTCKH